MGAMTMRGIFENGGDAKKGGRFEKGESSKTGGHDQKRGTGCDQKRLLFLNAK